MPLDEKQAEIFIRRLTDGGRLIEAGWVGFERATFPQGAGEVQRKEMRMAFFAGAQHLFASMITFLDAGEDVTDNDTRRFKMVANELDRFIEGFKREHGLPP